MFQNYVLVAIRNLKRERLYTAINVLGLAIGLTVCLLVCAYVRHELSFDRFHELSNRLYRVNYLIPEKNGAVTRSAATAFVVAPILRAQIPEIEAVVALADIPEAIVRVGNESYREPLLFADSQFFSLFSFPLVAGNRESALLNPNSVVLSERIALKYFGNEPPLGKIVSIEVRGRQEEFTVTGVCTRPPSNSSIDLDIMVPLRKLFSFYQGTLEFGWNLTWPSTYVLLRSDVSSGAVNAKLATLAAGLPVDNSGKTKILFGLQPIREIHFDYNVDNAPSNAGKPTYSYILTGIALLVLALACINFMTLAIGRSQTRTKEIGVRKVMGARTDQLFGRFLGEAAVLCAMATIIAFVLAELTLPAFNELAGQRISRSVWLDPITLIGVVSLVVVTSLLAGGYPATVLARTKLRDAVRGRASLLTGGTLTRSLVVLQFGLSIAFIVATAIMSNQIHYMQSTPIGFDKDNLLLIKLAGGGTDKLRVVERLRHELSGNPEVVSMCAAGRSFDGRGMSNSDYLPDSTLFTVCANPADENYVQTMGLSLVEGSNFTGSTLPDSLEPLLVNEALVRALKWKSALGQRVPGLSGGRVIGVVNDFNFQSLVRPIEPLVIPFARSESWSSEVRYVYLRLKSNNLGKTVAEIRRAWDRSTPRLPFDFQFMDDHIDAQYRFEQRWWKVMQYASFMAVLIACFGAFGLTALAAARRQKEIGVRKVLGATTGQIIRLLNREFVWLVAIGNLIAWPTAYLATDRWLGGFAYHVTVGIWPFLIAAVTTLAIVIVTVSVQAIRAALANPVDALKYE